jgi:hypothetical protein
VTGRPLSRLQRFIQEHPVGMIAFAISTAVIGGLLTEYLAEKYVRSSAASSPEPPRPQIASVPDKAVSLPDQRANVLTQQSGLDATGAARATEAPASVPTVRSALKPPPHPHQGGYVSSAAISGGDMLVLIVDEQSRIEPLLTTAVADALGANGGALTSDFVNAGVFARTYDGEPSALKRVDGIERIPLLVLGRIAAAYTSNDALETGLRKAEVDVTLRVYRPARAFATNLMHLAATGAGFSDRDAYTAAAREIARQLSEKLP